MTSSDKPGAKTARKTGTGAGWALKDVSEDTRAAIKAAAAAEGVAPGVWVERELKAAAARGPATKAEPGAEQEKSSAEALEDAVMTRINAFTDKFGEALVTIGRQVRDEAVAAYRELSEAEEKAKTGGKAAGDKPAAEKPAAPEGATTKPAAGGTKPGA